MRLTKTERNKRLKQIAEARKKHVRAFEDDTPDKKRARIAACEADMFLFGRTYLPHYFTDATPEFHLEWASLAETRNRLVNIAAPRGHAKSVVFALLKIVWWSVYRLRRLIVIGSDTETQAVGLVAFVMDELENNERIIADFGPQKNPGSWEDGSLITKSGVMIVGKGKGQSMRGLRNGPHRPDAFVGDDLENDEEQKNPRRVEKTIHWITRVVLPAMNPHGWSATVVGTILSRRSALSKLLAEVDSRTGEPLYLNRVYRALLADGSPLWASRFTAEYLADIREQIGSRAFNAEYLNNPKDDEGAFREEWMVEWNDENHTAAPVDAIVIYNDPSLGETTAHDFKATVALGRSGQYHDVLGAHIRRESVAAMVGGVFALYEIMKTKHPKAAIIVAFEENGFQALLKKDFEAEEISRGYHLPLQLVKNYSNKLARIESLSSVVERGKLRFKRGQTDQNTLIEQLLYLGGSMPDDGPDALECAHRLLNNMGAGRGAYESLVKRRSHGAIRVESASSMTGVF